MRSLVLLACLCAVAAYAHAEERQNQEYAVEENFEGFENTNYIFSLNSEYNGASQFNGEDQGYSSTTQNYYYADSESLTTNSGFNSERRGRYRSFDQENVESAPVVISSSTCKEKNERYSVPGSCDRYIECLNGTAEEKQCPDGLRYNPNVKFNVYPCQYPIDVPCLGRSALQPAQPTNDCPNQFGYFKTGDAKNCSGFRNCVNGVGYDFTCPEGLAFSSDTYRCEWPDEVTDCDAEAFLGFRCPEIPISKELGPPAGFRSYRSTGDCQIYFICINNRPRRLTCGGYSAFDELSGSCVAADEVPECPTELRSNAAKSRDAEEKRQAAQVAYEKLRYAPQDFSNSRTTTDSYYVPDILDNETQRPVY